MRGQPQTLSWRSLAEEITDFSRENRQERPRQALFLTFELDPARFADEVLPPLVHRFTPFRVAVIADAGAFSRRSRALQGRCNYYLVPAVGLFHAKLVVIQAGTAALVGVGSSNLTAGGLGANLELFRFWRSDQGDHRMIGAAARFLQELAASSLPLPKAARDIAEGLSTTLRVHVPRAQHPVSSPLLSSINRPLIDQMRDVVASCGRAAEVHALSPLYASGRRSDDESAFEVSAVNMVRNKLCASLFLYTDPLDGAMPTIHGINHDHCRCYRGNESESAGDPEEGESVASSLPARLHAKAYLVRLRDGSGVLFHGSANLTSHGLCKSVARGGNLELLAWERLRRPAVNRFLDNLNDAHFFGRPRRFGGKLRQHDAGRGRPKGLVLGGTVKRSRSAIALELDVTPTENPRQVTIASAATGGFICKVARQSKRARCWRLDDEAQLDLLNLRDLQLEAGTWSTQLWEVTRSRGSRSPFIVNLPVTATARCPAKAGLGGLLEALVLDECAVWPKVRPGQRTNGSPTDEDGRDNNSTDGDKELAKVERDCDFVNKQGRLDQIATHAALLLRKVVDSKQSPHAKLHALKLIQDEIARADSEEGHRGRVVRRWIKDAQRAITAGGRR